MRILLTDDILKEEKEILVRFELPDMGKDGRHADEGDEPYIAVFSLCEQGHFKLHTLIEEHIQSNPNKETREVAVDWLEDITKRIAGNKLNTKD